MEMISAKFMRSLGHGQNARTFAVEANGRMRGTQRVYFAKLDQDTPTVLVAESDDDARYLLKSLLELKGFYVLEAKDGQQAIDTALRKRPDLLLIQLKLPIVSGFTAIRRVKSHADLRDVPIIAMSFNNPTTNHNLALAAGCNAHVENPIEFDRLEGLIDRLLPGDRVPLATVLIQ